MLKGKHKNTIESCLIWKTAHFDANCMKTGLLTLKILQFYVFKMAANGGHHFEIKIKTENYKTQCISQKHAYRYTFDKCDVNRQFMSFFLSIVLLLGIIGKNQYQL